MRIANKCQYNIVEKLATPSTVCCMAYKTLKTVV